MRHAHVFGSGFVALFSFLLGACSAELVPPDSVRLGRREVTFGSERGTVVIPPSAPPVRQISVVPRLNDIQIRVTQILFEDGPPFEPQLDSQQLRVGRGHIVIDLPGEARRIREVAFRYQKINNAARRAVVEIWGSQRALVDVDRNSYATIKIGSQIWMTENLRVRCDPGGHPLQSYYLPGEEFNIRKFGRLYPYASAVKACPAGWRLPTRMDVENLLAHFGGPETAGAALKEGGASGFGALLAGGRSSQGTFENLGIYGSFWTADEAGPERAWYFSLMSWNDKVEWFSGEKTKSLSVRYVRD